MKSTTFQILNLPLLAIQNALCNLTIPELIEFALLSRVCRKVVRLMRPKKNINTLTVSFDWSKKIRIRTPDGMEFRIDQYYMEDRRHAIRVDVKTANRLINSMFAWVDFLFEILNCSVHCLDIHHSSCPGYFEEISAWISNRQVSLPYCEVTGYCDALWCQADFGHFLNKLKVTEKFDIGFAPPSNFRYDGNFETKQLYVSGDARWFTIENLLNSNKCERIELITSRLVCEDVNLFLKYWIDGKFPNLRNFRVNREDLNQDVIMAGIDFVQLDETVQHEYTGASIGKLVFRGGLQVVQNNGIRAICVITNSRYAFYFSVIF